MTAAQKADAPVHGAVIPTAPPPGDPPSCHLVDPHPLGLASHLTISSGPFREVRLCRLILWAWVLSEAQWGRCSGA